MSIVSTEPIAAITTEPPMIEDTDLTLRILRHLARDDVPFPANLSLEALQEAFPDKDADAVAYSVICAFDSGLLLGGHYTRTPTSTRTHYTIGMIDGLSHQGGEYVRAAETHYQEAVGAVRKMGRTVTTEAVSRMLWMLFDAAAKKMLGI